MSNLPPPVSRKSFRFFYVGSAVLLLILTFIGFQHFYLHGRNFLDQELDDTRRGLLITHGVFMTAWMLLFVGQTLLIATRNLKHHRILGWVSSFVSLLVVGLGIMLVFPIPPIGQNEELFYGLTPRQFNGFILSTVVMFAAFVAVGIWKRKRPTIHRAMMLMSMLSVMPAVFDRIPWIVNLYFESDLGLVFGPFFGPMVLGVILLGVNRLLQGTWDRWLIIGNAVYVCSSVLVMFTVKTSVWEFVAGILSSGN